MSTNRLGVYFFYDKDGFVEEQVFYYLENLKPFMKELAVVVNGKIEDRFKDRISKIADKLIVRDNVGFDSWAYKTVIEDYGYEKIVEFDELLLCNFTCYGPVGSFGIMFDEMAKKDCDFWGACKHARLENTILFPNQQTRHVPEHIMSYFMVFRKNVITSPEFKKYWDNLPQIRSYNDAVTKHEMVFTEHFENLGFKADSFIGDEYIRDAKTNTPIFNGYEMLKEKKCPIVKRKLFLLPRIMLLWSGRGKQSSDTIKYIKKETTFNEDFIIQDVLRTVKGYEIRETFNNNLIIPSEYLEKSSLEIEKLNLAIVLQIDSFFDMQYLLEKIYNMPKKSDLFLFVSDENIKKQFEKELDKNHFSKIYIEVVSDKFVLVEKLHLFSEYDYVCRVKSEFFAKLKNNVMNLEFQKHCFDGVLKTKEFVVNLLNRFEKDKWLGHISSPSIYLGMFYALAKGDFDSMFDKIKPIIKNKTDVEICDLKNIDISFENCFWFRPKALQSMNVKWENSLFKDLSKDEIRFFENLYQLIVQYNNFYYAWSMDHDDVSNHFNNLYLTYRKNLYIKKLIRKKIKYSILSLLTFKYKPFADKKQRYKMRIKTMNRI